MKDVLDWLLANAGGSIVGVLAVAGCVWGLKKLVEWASADLLAKGLEDHKRDIAKQLADQQREHERSLEALRSELRTVESEAADLRAHSLGLEAERRRNFEAKRAEVCAELYSALISYRRQAGRVENDEFARYKAGDAVTERQLQTFEDNKGLRDAAMQGLERMVEAAAVYLDPAALEEVEGLVESAFDVHFGRGETSGTWKLCLRRSLGMLREQLGGPPQPEAPLTDDSSDAAVG